MIYLICYDWLSTRGNHAGMSHLCDMLVGRYADIYALKKFQFKHVVWLPSKYICRKIDKCIDKFNNLVFEFRFRKILRSLHDNDTIVLMEYLHPIENQSKYAIKIREQNDKVKIIGLAHLTPSALVDLGVGATNIDYWVKPVDRIITFGYSLSDWLVSIGVSKEKVVTAKHYVDSDYYSRNHPILEDRPRIICMGNLQRNYSILEQIVSRCLDIEFTLCSGRAQLTNFSKYSNVRLLNYLSEEQLREEIEKANVSLNVMDDTVGSNVITTSMAMGLAMIVSDVGSIRDYCDDRNAIFCKGVEDFVQAINTIQIKPLSEASLVKAKEFGIESFYNAISSL